MPELPEVETVLQVLKRKINQKTIQKVDVFYLPMIQYPTVVEFQQQLIGQTFIGFKRLGKNLIFELNDYYLISHLRMEGKYFVTQFHEKTKHEHVIFYFEDEQLVYHDIRKFGTFHLYKKTEEIKCLKHYGEDALEINFEHFYEKVSRKNTSIKQCLLDQSIISGIGNIYADEIIFKSKLHPLQNTKTISKRKYREILKNAKIILSQAIASGGTTIRSYTSDVAIDGRFQLQLQIHMQKRCGRCHRDVQKIKVAQRGTYICPKCQKNKVIAITGNIGSGKSQVSKILLDYGFPVLDLDQVVKSLYEDKEIIQEVNQLLFNEKKDTLDFKSIATIIFNDTQKRNILEQYLYPKVYTVMQQFSASHPISFVEMALVFEKQWDKYFDEIICVSTKGSIAMQRLIQHRFLTKEEIDNRRKSQYSMNYKIQHSDYVIENNSTNDILKNNVLKYLKERGYYGKEN